MGCCAVQQCVDWDSARLPVGWSSLESRSTTQYQTWNGCFIAKKITVWYGKVLLHKFEGNYLQVLEQMVVNQQSGKYHGKPKRFFSPILNGFCREFVSFSIRHFNFAIAKLFAIVHRQTTTANAKSNTFWTEFRTMTPRTKELSIMWAGICWVQQFVAQFCWWTNTINVWKEHGQRISPKITLHISWVAGVKYERVWEWKGELFQS